MARAPEPSTAAIIGEALAAASVAVLVTTPARVITAANAAAYALLDYSASKLTGEQVRALYAASDDYETVDALIARGSSSPLDASVSITLRDSQGALVDVSVVVLPVHDASGKISSIIELMTPADPNGTAVATNTARNHTDLVRFARGAAHDFKNFLTIITGNVQLAQNETNKVRRQRFFEDAEYTSKRAVELADKMIAFARDRPTAPETIDIAQFIKLQVRLWQLSARSGISLLHATADDLPPIFADRSGLENALLNLVINARDSIADSGRITISADVIETSFDHGGADTVPKAYVAIAVRDTGTGMTPHVRQRAFDPFFSTKSASNGTGLGLATVMGFARQAGGHAAIESKLGSGTTVTIFLPLRSE